LRLQNLTGTDAAPVDTRRPLDRPGVTMDNPGVSIGFGIPTSLSSAGGSRSVEKRAVDDVAACGSREPRATRMTSPAERLGRLQAFLLIAALSIVGWGLIVLLVVMLRR
jgi:hypothetical protein